MNKTLLHNMHVLPFLIIQVDIEFRSPSLVNVYLYVANCATLRIDILIRKPYWWNKIEKGVFK